MTIYDRIRMLRVASGMSQEEKTGRGRRDQSRESDRLKTILVKIAPKLPRKIKENPEE